MQLKSYKDASKIEERYLPQLATRQAECWWAKPFDEYRICQNTSCKAIFSTQEVLWDVLKIRAPESSCIDFRCTECWDETKEVYQQEEFIELMKEYFLWEVSWLLVLDESDQVEGFWVISKTNISSLMRLELNTRPGSYEINETIKKISQTLYEDENCEDEEIICFHQIYISPIVRNSDLSYQAFKNLFEINKDEYKDIPLIWESKYDNKFYPILRSMGVENITHDKYGYILQTLSKYSHILDFLETHNGYQDFLSGMIKYKKEARDILKKHPEFKKRKFYK